MALRNFVAATVTQIACDAYADRLSNGGVLRKCAISVDNKSGHGSKPSPKILSGMICMPLMGACDEPTGVAVSVNPVELTPNVA